MAAWHDLEALEAQRAADEELDHESPIDELFADQVGAANLIVLSKADLLDDDAEARARATVEARQAPTPIIPVSGGAAPMDAILGLDMEDQAHARSAHMHHHHDDHHHEEDHDR